MSMIPALLALVGLSLFLSRFFKTAASAMPLVAVAGTMLWMTLWGCMGLLQLGGWLWYAAGFAGLGFMIIKEKTAILRKITPGFVLFIAGAVLFTLYFAVEQPLFTQWDEFTFWGTAAKVTVEKNELYTTAQANLANRSYPPGMIVFAYVMQFFNSSFSEWQMMAAYAVVYVAVFAAGVSLWDKRPAMAMIAMVGMLLLPFLFETGEAGNMSYTYLSVMGDLPLAALFGGALCFYFGDNERNWRTLLSLMLIVGALAAVKDTGFALGCIVWLVVLVDMLLVRRKEVSFGKIKGIKAVLLYAVCVLGAVLLVFVGWMLYRSAVQGATVTNVGAGGEQLSQFGMLLKGLQSTMKTLLPSVFGTVEAGDPFTMVWHNMLSALRGRMADGTAYPWLRVWVFGSGIRMLLLILGVSAVAWLCSPKGRKARVAWCTISMGAGFAAYYLFIIFTYAYIFKAGEQEILKDYNRYIFPYWMGWLMVALVLLASAAKERNKTEDASVVLTNWWAAKRSLIAQGLVLVLCAGISLGVAKQCNAEANFLRISPSLYTVRLDTKRVVDMALAQGMKPEDKVYLISQGDNSARYYQLGYEMPAEMLRLYGGVDFPDGRQAASLVALGDEAGYAEGVACTPKELAEFLQRKESTAILLDVLDSYIVDVFGPYFADGLVGWGSDGEYEGGRRYYHVTWQSDGVPLFVPAEEGAVT